LKFYNLKTVLPNWLFSVKFSNQTDLLQPYHVIDVTIPMYKFKVEKQNFGAVNRSFTVIDQDSDALIVSVTFEDSHDGVVLQLIHELQKKIIGLNGLHKPINEQNIGDMDIEIKNYQGKSVGLFNCKNISYVGTENLTFSYTSNETMKYKIDFRCDVVKFIKYNVNLIPIYDTQNTNINTLLK
jgi:hypothetical protein